jgi:ATP-dependent protease ClpP protease subunit
MTTKVNSFMMDAVLFAFFLLLFTCLFGCAAAGCATQPTPRGPMFSVSPEPTPAPQLSDHQRQVMRLVEMLSPPEAGPYTPGDPVFVQFPIVDADAVAKVKLAVKLAQHTNRLLVLDLDGLGGRVLRGLEIAEVINDSGVTVNCIIKKEADSMHAFLFELVNCRRALYQDARIVFHHPAVDYDAKDTYADLVRKAGVEEDLAHALCADVSARTGGKVSAELCHFQLHANERHTWTISGKDAVASGLADYLLHNVEEK